MQRKQSTTAPNDEVQRLLKIIIRLLIESQISAEKMTMTDAVHLLHSMDFGPTEIGEIIGWSKGSVGNALSETKKVNKVNRK